MTLEECIAVCDGLAAQLAPKLPTGAPLNYPAHTAGEEADLEMIADEMERRGFPCAYSDRRNLMIRPKPGVIDEVEVTWEGTLVSVRKP